METLLFPKITIDPAVQNGKPVIAGTRVPVDVLVGHVAAGNSVEEVAKEYRLEHGDVLAALRYAAKIVAEEKIMTPVEHAFSH